MSNVNIVNEILADAFKQLDQKALEQIANHCTFNYNLAEKYLKQIEDKSEMLAYSAREVIAKANLAKLSK